MELFPNEVFDFEIKPVEVSMVHTEERAWLALGYDSVRWTALLARAQHPVVG